LTREMPTTRKKKYRWKFCRISGNRV